MTDKAKRSKNLAALALIWSLAWPTMAEQVMQTAVQYIDTAMVGSLGTDAGAAVGSTTTIGWLICGVLWGLSFIVPGFSSSTLLLFFGIYERMSAGISSLDFSVLIPLGCAMLATLLLFSRLMKFVFDKFYSVVSHCVLGFVVATTLMIVPDFMVEWYNVLIYIFCIICGGVASFFFSKACEKMKA